MRARAPAFTGNGDDGSSGATRGGGAGCAGARAASRRRPATAGASVSTRGGRGCGGSSATSARGRDVGVGQVRFRDGVPVAIDRGTGVTTVRLLTATVNRTATVLLLILRLLLLGAAGRGVDPRDPRRAGDGRSFRRVRPDDADLGLVGPVAAVRSNHSVRDDLALVRALGAHGQPVSVSVAGGAPVFRDRCLTIDEVRGSLDLARGEHHHEQPSLAVFEVHLHVRCAALGGDGERDPVEDRLGPRVVGLEPLDELLRRLEGLAAVGRFAPLLRSTHHGGFRLRPEGQFVSCHRIFEQILE